MVRFSGRVQGVGFRALVRRICEIEGIHGWVRNLPDGDVEGAFWGAPSRLEQVLQKIHSARGHLIDSTSSNQWEPENAPEEFRIRY
ncbi:MAG: acylphosphatase [Acidobacteria bacterium]|nr:acylphosphatase [Acidobacteriota bacterium]